jgi:hypothetical protein
MTVKASGCSALILATGLWVCFAGPSQAAAGTDNAAAASTKSQSAPTTSSKQDARHSKRYAHRKSGKVALKSSTGRKAADAAADDGDTSTAIPPSVANANAQLASADVPGSNAKAMSARANILLANPADAPPAAETQIVSADQLNDVDRALHESPPAAPVQMMASAEKPAEPVMASGNESSTWDQTSLIGKIFIGFGALLTMASAARMFMA